MLTDEIDLSASAILLDVDGTLLDLAPTPHDVEVAPQLRLVLARIAESTDGALAFVSGRTLAELDRIFSPLKLSAIGGHGAQIRVNAKTIVREDARLDPELRARLIRVGERSSGILVEDKGFSVALHYRLVPQYAHAVREEVYAICAAFPAASIEILPGKSVVEVKQPSFNKGIAVRQLMQELPFHGRRPVFVGDDVTDDYVFAVLPAYNGLGFSVGREVEGIAGCFMAPRDVRHWLERLADPRRLPDPSREEEP